MKFLWKIKRWIFDKIIYPLFEECISELISDEVMEVRRKYEDMLEECYKEIDERNRLEGIRF